MLLSPWSSQRFMVARSRIAQVKKTRLRGYCKLLSFSDDDRCGVFEIDSENCSKLWTHCLALLTTKRMRDRDRGRKRGTLEGTLSNCQLAAGASNVSATCGQPRICFGCLAQSRQQQQKPLKAKCVMQIAVRSPSLSVHLAISVCL